MARQGENEVEKCGEACKIKVSWWKKLGRCVNECLGCAMQVKVCKTTWALVCCMKDQSTPKDSNQIMFLLGVNQPTFRVALSLPFKASVRGI